MSSRTALARAFGCDLRSLAALRIALGLLLLADVAWRLPLFDALYSSEGAWPQHAARNEIAYPWSLYFLCAADWWTWSLFGAAALSAAGLALGWHTRLMTIVSWLLLASLQQRNVLVLNGGDTILRLLLFWGMFLPLGARWSLDARRRAQPSGGVLFGAGTVALLGQVALIYVFNAIYKTGDSWRVTGDATLETLRLETYVTPIGQWLAGFPEILRAATRAIWWLELLGPALAFVPWRNSAFRLVAVAIFIGFHAGLLLTIRIGLFPVIGMIAWLPFLPAGFWDWITRRRDVADARPPRTTLPQQIAAGALFAYVAAWNVFGLFPRQKPHGWFRQSGLALQLQQKWSLFAPDPLRSEGWLVGVIETSEGVGYDAFTGAITDWKRPRHLGERLPSAQWRKFLAAMRDTSRPDRAELLAAWLKRDWQRRHSGDEVVRVRLHYLWEFTAKRQSPPVNWLLYENPPGPIGAMVRAAGKPPAPPAEHDDL